MTDKLREILEDVQTVYKGKGMIVHPNSFDKLRMEVIKLDNINKQQSEQIEKMKCCGNCAKRGHICVAEEMQGNLCGKNKVKWELRR